MKFLISRHDNHALNLAGIKVYKQRVTMLIHQRAHELLEFSTLLFLGHFDEAGLDILPPAK